MNAFTISLVYASILAMVLWPHWLMVAGGTLLLYAILKDAEAR